MKQILQDLKSGSTEVADVPVPMIRDGQVLIRTRKSLISTGTERMLLEFGKANYVQKAIQQPDKVRMVLDKIRTDGLLSTAEAVMSKLEAKVPLGYSNVGEVVEVGQGVRDLRIGDRVVSNGCHAEYVAVGQNLVCKVPDDVSDEQAVFTVAASIGLQGVRMSKPTLGETFVVTGLGLIGLLTVQILKANGCRVIGVDFDRRKLELAAQFGAVCVDLGEGQDPVAVALAQTNGKGVDGVIITAAAKNDEIVHQAAQMCRKRGRIVLVGVVDLDLQRSDFYEKELSFSVSCSYGPGRYDHEYEDLGRDYPFGFVRWTEQRNFEAILALLESGAMSTEPLISSSFMIEEATNAYSALGEDSDVLGLLLEYPADGSVPGRESRVVKIASAKTATPATNGRATIAAIGAGNYASRVLLPELSKACVRLKTIATAQGVSGSMVGKKFGFENSTTAAEEIFEDEDVDAVVVATRHDSHGSLVVQALDSGKSVFVEKPLALHHSELDRIESAYENALKNGNAPTVMVGFNRRFAPLVQRMKGELTRSTEPLCISISCNAGFIDSSSWVQSPEIGGGRIIGEACHFVDLARFLAGSKIASVNSLPMTGSAVELACPDTAFITISFENGSIASVRYYANGHRSFPKERIEVSQAGRIFVVDNFKSLREHGASPKKTRARKDGRGQAKCISMFCDAVSGQSESPIQFDELIEVSRASIDAASLATSGRAE